MLKPQDCIVLLKLVANPEMEWSQRQLAQALCISLAEVNAGIKRLIQAGLLRKGNAKQPKFIPILSAVEEFMVHAMKYLFPGKLGEYTRGIPTGVGSPLFQNKIALGEDPVPVWPDAQGQQRGVALFPIYPSVPRALRESPDQNFYEFLVLSDVIRSGRARERNMAIKILKDRLSHAK